MNGAIDELVKGHREAITVKKVFGDPFQQNGLTIIPAAKVMGGGGGGAGESPEGAGQGSGTGFGIAAKPVGVYVIRGEDVQWRPAIDFNRILGSLFVLAALWMLLTSRRRK